MVEPILGLCVSCQKFATLALTSYKLWDRRRHVLSLRRDRNRNRTSEEEDKFTGNLNTTETERVRFLAYFPLWQKWHEMGIDKYFENWPKILRKHCQMHNGPKC